MAGAPAVTFLLANTAVAKAACRDPTLVLADAKVSEDAGVQAGQLAKTVFVYQACCSFLGEIHRTSVTELSKKRDSQLQLLLLEPPVGGMEPTACHKDM